MKAGRVTTETDNTAPSQGFAYRKRKSAFAIALMVTTALVGGLAVPVGLAVAQTVSTASTQSFSIPAQPLQSALVQFSNQSGLELFVSADLVRGRNSPGVSGQLSSAEALARLLAGSGLSYQVNGNSVTITDPAAPVVYDGSIILEQVDVTAWVENAWGPVEGYVANQSATGTKTDTPLIETPQSISVVGRQEMEDRGVQTLGQAVRYTPGIVTDLDGAVQNGYDAVFLRGFRGDQYLDGLQSAGWFEPFGTERIEVLRGPASVLYGQGSPGGIVGAVSKRPTDETIREIGILTSAHGGIQGSFDFGGKLTEDGTLLYRFTGLGKNLGTQFASDSELQRVYIAPAVTWRPTEDTTLTVMAKYQNDPGFLALPTLPYIGTVIPRPDGFSFGPSFYLSDPDFDADSYRRTFQIGYLFEHKFNEVFTVRQNLRYTDNESNRQFIDIDSLGLPPETLLDRAAFRYYTENKHFVVDTNVQANFSTGPIAHTAIVGLDYRDVTTLSKSAPIQWGAGIPQLDIYNPQYGIYSGPAADFTAGNRQDSSQIGIYVQDHLKWGNLSLLLGGRYDWADSRTYNTFANDVLTDEMSQSAFTGRFGVVYEFENGIAPYISYAESFEPQPGTTAPERGSIPFEPTTGQQWEVGVKYQPEWFDGFFTAALFDLRRQNVPTTDPINNLFTIQHGEVRSQGIELSGTANLTPDLRFVASYSYTDNIVTKDNLNFQGISMVGKAPIGIPMHSASAWLDYTFSDGPLAGLSLGGGIRYQGETWGDRANTDSLTVPAVTLFDAAIRYDFGKANPQLEGLNLSINATNLFDTAHVKSCYSALFCYYGESRSITASLTYRW